MNAALTLEAQQLANREGSRAYIYLHNGGVAVVSKWSRLWPNWSYLGYVDPK